MVYKARPGQPGLCYTDTPSWKAKKGKKKEKEKKSDYQKYKKKNQFCKSAIIIKISSFILETKNIQKIKK